MATKILTHPTEFYTSIPEFDTCFVQCLINACKYHWYEPETVAIMLSLTGFHGSPEDKWDLCGLIENQLYHDLEVRNLSYDQAYVQTITHNGKDYMVTAWCSWELTPTPEWGTESILYSVVSY